MSLSNDEESAVVENVFTFMKKLHSENMLP